MGSRGHLLARTGIAALLAFVAWAALACGSEDTTSTSIPRATPTSSRPVAADIGVIAYVDDNGCIAKIAANGDAATAKTFCPPTRLGVTYMSWLDGERAVYTIPETAALGWRMIDFTKGTDTALSLDDAPKIRILTDAPWYRSIESEVVEFNPDGLISRVEGQDRIVIFDPLRGGDTAGMPRMLTWSPDGKWLLIARSASKSLWVVSRDGSTTYQVAASSRGRVSWWMPKMGALPHLDLTCTTVAAFDCQVSLVSPALSANVDPARTGGDVLLEWSICPGATGYEVVVYPPGATNPAIDSYTTGTTTRVPGAMLASAPTSGWRWKVRSVIGPKLGPWSEERAFAVSSAN